MEWYFLRILKLLLVLIITVVSGGCIKPDAIIEGKPKVGIVDPGSPKVIKPALLRLEDVGPGGPYLGEENLHKLYAIAEYLQQEGIPFHLSLIPRIVVPKKGYDAGIADDTPYVRSFVATIREMQKMGGIIGIHGYTHQTGSDPSGWGYEFYDRLENPRVPDTYEYARDRIDRAIALFEKAGITPGYWETPHYTASLKQHPAFEEQMGLLYENKHRGEMTNNYKTIDFSGKGFRGFVTVPAPLGNIDRDGDMEKMIKKLDHPGVELASFFYHPFREFKYLYKSYNARGEVYYVYDQNSPLHVLIKAFKDKGYTFVSVYSLVRFVPAQRLEGLPFGEGDVILAGRFGPEGRRKLLVWNKGPNQWRMYEYTAAWYSPRRVRAFSDLGVWARDWVPESNAVPLVADFTGDGNDDLLVFSPGQGTFRLAEYNGNRLVPRSGTVLALPGAKTLYPLAGDFNQDGLADVAVYDADNHRIGLAFSTGGGFKQIRWQSIELLRGNGRKLLAGDFNGDHRDDIAVMDAGSGEWRVLLAAQRGIFTEAAGPWLNGWGHGESRMLFASDVNGDGRCDLVSYSRTGRWQVAVSDGRKFIQRGDFGPWGTSAKGVPLVADINGDGRSDLIIADEVKGVGYNLDAALSVMQK